MTCHIETLVAAYVLGILEPADRDLVRAHLPHCAECRAALAESAPLPALLSRVSPEELLAAPPMPDEAMLGRLLAAAGGARRVRRQRLFAAAAAVVVLAVGGTVTAVALNGNDHDGRITLSAQDGIHATVDLQRAASGTEFGLRLSGVRAEEHCRLVAISDDGRRDVAANWTATYRGTAEINGSTGMSRDQISRLIVETDDGQELASVDL